MTLKPAPRRARLQTGLGDYLDRPIGAARQYFQTIWAVLKGDPRLLVRNAGLMSPPLYFAATVAIAVAFLKSAWPDDPVKTFEGPAFLRPLQPFLDFIPLPMFVTALLYLALISAPMFVVSSALGYPVRLSRVVAASIYAFATFMLLLVLLLIGRILSYEIFVGDQLQHLGTGSNAWYWFGVACALFLAFRSFKLLGIAHGMNGYKFAVINSLVASLPFTVIGLATEPTSGWRRISDLFDLPVQLFYTPTASMAPTLPIGTEFIVNREIPLSQLRPGDLVTYYVPHEARTFVQRIVGRGGDKIQMIDGVLQINGKPVKREPADDYVGIGESGSGIQHIKRWKETLPNGASYFTLDLVDNGPLDNMPLHTVPPGHYFMMGDNRDNVLDSRSADRIGDVPGRNIIGKAYFILYPRDRGYLYKRADD
jgi:signal peptidase I